MANSNSGASVEELKADISTLQHDLGAVVDTLKRLAIDGTEQNGAKLRAAGAAARQRISDATATTEKAIVDRPFTSAAIAFGVGFLLGKLLDRR